MNRESSIQLVYQLTILIHNYIHFPVIELIYRDLPTGLPSALWCLKLILLCVSSLLSTYSILSLPIQAAKMRSLKESFTYVSFRKNVCMLSKRIFQLLWHIFTTYIIMFLVMESERFVYFRQYVSGKIGEKNMETYGFIMFGSIIFLIFPLLVIFESFLAVIIFVAGESRKKGRKILSKFGSTLRIRVKMRAQLRRSNKCIPPYMP